MRQEQKISRKLHDDMGSTPGSISYKMIAPKLFITYDTVRAHMKRYAMVINKIAVIFGKIKIILIFRYKKM